MRLACLLFFSSCLSSTQERLIFFIRCILITLFLSTPAQALTLLNWPDYMDAQLLEEFKQNTGIEVTEIFFDSEVELDRLVIDSAIPIDIMVVSDTALKNYIALNWVEPIPAELKSSFPNLTAVPSKLEVNNALDYGVPYFWGTLGIAYRKDRVDRALKSWSDILMPDATLKGKVALLDSSRDVFAMTQKMLGFSVNTHNKDEINRAANVLKENAAKYHSLDYTALDEQSLLVNGEVFAAAMFNGDALVLKEMNEHIEYVLPVEGGNIWVDSFAVHSKSQYKEEAWKFLQFISDTKQVVKLTQAVQFAPPSLDVKPLLPKEITTNKAIYPDEQALSNSEAYHPLPADIARHINQEFTLIKQIHRKSGIPK